MENLGMDFADYKSILAQKGSIIGKVDNCNINEFMSSLDDTLIKSISQAKGILVKFEVNLEQSLLHINNIMAQIHELANEDAEIVFSTEIVNIDKDELGYQLVLTGL